MSIGVKLKEDARLDFLLQTRLGRLIYPTDVNRSLNVPLGSLSASVLRNMEPTERNTEWHNV